MLDDPLHRGVRPSVVRLSGVTASGGDRREHDEPSERVLAGVPGGIVQVQRAPVLRLSGILEVLDVLVLEETVAKDHSQVENASKRSHRLAGTDEFFSVFLNTIA